MKIDTGMLSINKEYLITTDAWFVAPDGYQYKSVWGTVKGVLDSESTLGLKTNRGSANWYVVIGNMIIAGCQIHYVIQTGTVNLSPAKRTIEYDGKLFTVAEDKPRIFNANANI